jgi:hypothetical protein
MSPLYVSYDQYDLDDLWNWLEAKGSVAERSKTLV